MRRIRGNAQGGRRCRYPRARNRLEIWRGKCPDALQAAFVKYKNTLEKHFKDVQDIEFTIQESRLHILQTRNGKRTTQAAVKIAVDMVKEG